MARTIATAREPLDMRGKTITTFILFEIVAKLDDLQEGESLRVLTDEDEAIDNDIRAWCRATGTELSVSEEEGERRSYEIVKAPPRPRAGRLAMVVSKPGLEELLSPLGFALAAALEGVEVHIYFQGPAVRVLRAGFKEKLPGLNRPFSRFARKGLAKAGHVPAQEKLRQLRRLEGRFYLCGPSMKHFRVTKSELIFDDLPVVEYATFMEVMKGANIHIFVQ